MCHPTDLELLALKSPLDIAATEEVSPRVDVAPAAYSAQQLLSDASVALTASLELDETIGRVARVIVPRVADWCIIDLIDDDGPERSVRRATAIHAAPSADKVERIFESFVQLHHGRTRTHDGTGLELAISRDLARTMHGEIAVQSSVDCGSRFTLTLPRFNGDRTSLSTP